MTKRTLLAVFFVCLLWLSGCAPHDNPPIDCLSHYLAAYKSMEYREAYECLSEKDRAIYNYKQFIEKYVDQGTYATFLLNNTDYAYLDSEIQENKAIVSVKITCPQTKCIDDIGEHLLGSYWEVEQAVRSKNEGKIPKMSFNETYTLVKENGVWRVFLNLEIYQEIEIPDIYKVPND